MTPSQLAGTFILEAEDLLNQIEEVVLDLDKNTADPEAVNRLFRAFHTIKGSGAMFGFDAVASFTHQVETVLDRVRNGSLAMSRPLVQLVLNARDHIKILLEKSADVPASVHVAGESIVEALKALLGPSVPSAAIIPAAIPAAIEPAFAANAPASWRIYFRPAHNIAATGQNPVALLNELRALGSCRVKCDTAAIPPFDQLDPEACHLAWEVALTTEKDANAIRDVFIFIEGECELEIERLAATPASQPALAPQAPLSAMISAEPAKTAAASPSPTARAIAGKDSSVRVPSDRLDRLVNLVGELVMNQSRLSQVADRSDQSDLAVPVEELERLIAELRDTVLGIRMMPIGATFNRFRRLVHDLSLELGKEIDLVTEGEETELDKTVLDQLGDPLVHLIRNSIDHGIELPDDRERSGKPRRGKILLSAAHIGSNVVITIQDDGRGLAVEAIRAKAVEKKLVAPDSNLSEREIFRLILLPGFSTAKTITNVSGRGVGMDVVQREIDALRGTIDISSVPGQGTTISATLPLTLAIIDGLLVSLGEDKFIVPMSAVVENVELTREQRTRNNGRNVVAVRGDLVPYIRLRETFALPGDGPDVEKIVLVRMGGERVGLVVDRVLGSHQTVIQSLGRFYRDVGVFSGATIMGDGRVALIFDVGGLVRFVDGKNGISAKAPPRDSGARPLSACSINTFNT
jgi:two-component system chemotaxis sensor kinase CheA